MTLDEASTIGGSSDSFVLYCIIRRSAKDKGPIQFLLMEKQGYLTFPPTKFRPGEDLYQALIRPMGEDLGFPQDSYFPERELGSIPSEGTSPRYPGLPDIWYLYPAHVPLVSDRCLQNESLNLQHGAGCCFKHPRVTADYVRNNLFSINGSFSGNTPWQ